MTNVVLATAAELEPKVKAALIAAGADEASSAATTRALMHASGVGVDSHGVRLVPHYVRDLTSGQINGHPDVKIVERSAVVLDVDADAGLGHYASYRAIDAAMAAARRSGIAAAGVRNSSHYGAAGAYARAGAQEGLILVSLTNADSLVALHEGAKPFHGTNPISVGVPVPGQKPWLLDMATSSIPFNRVLLNRVLGRELANGVAADLRGEVTRDAKQAEMLVPVGGSEFGFKGAALGGLVTILSAVLTGATADPFMQSMMDPSIRTPRNVGHFFLAIDPAFFGGGAAFGENLVAYLEALRGSPVKAGGRVMAPGDREWEVEADRAANGIPVDPETAAFLGL